MNPAVLVEKKYSEIDWQAFEQSLYDRFHVNAVALNSTGDRVSKGTLPLANDLCALIKKHPKGLSRVCEALKKCLICEVRLRKRCVADECVAGIYRIMMPVLCKDDIEGFISICGRPFVSCERIYCCCVKDILDLDEQVVRDLLARISPMGPRTIKDMKEFIQGYVH